MVTSVCYDKGRHVVFLLRNEQATNNLTGKRIYHKKLKQSTEIFRTYVNQSYQEVQLK